MAGKSSHPALYEKIRIREGLLGAPPRNEPAPKLPTLDIHDNARGGAGNLITSGRTIQLPIGYVLLVGALTIAFVAFAFMMGHRKGFAAARGEFEQRYVASNSAGSVNDPIGNLGPAAKTSTNSSKALYQAPTQGSSLNDEAATVRSRPRSQWGPVQARPDPRKKGSTYFILAETNLAGAVKLAEFCRTHGLETYVVPSKNDRLRRVVAFPGFDASDRSKSHVKALESFIHTIGDKWARTERGGSNLHDAYPNAY